MCDCMYVVPLRATTVAKTHSLNEDEKANVEEAMGQTSTDALSSDYRTSLCNHSICTYSGNFHCYEDKGQCAHF